MEKELTGYPSIDKPWLKYYSQEAINAKLPECTIYENVWQHNKGFPDDIALTYYGSKITYRKLFREVERTAKALRKAGVNKGDCVTLCVAGVPEAVYTVLACSRIGAIANFINPMFTTEQMIDRINDTETDLLIVLDAMYRFIADAIDRTCVKRVVVVPAAYSMPILISILIRLKNKSDKRLYNAMHSDKKYVPWKDFVKEGEPYAECVDEPYEKDCPVVMVYSSGTTGASKGIVLTNDGINATIAYYLRPDFRYNRGNTFLQMIPAWFSTGVVLSVLMPLCLGITVIPELLFCKETFTHDIEKYRPNMTLAATSLWVYAMRSNKLTDCDLSRLSYPITGGEQVLPQVESELNSFLKKRGSNAILYKGYGMCELGSTISSSSTVHSKLGSVGYPILGVSVAAFDMETNLEMPYGQRGELRVCSPARMKEYYRNPEATSAFFWKDNKGVVWGCTGDIGYVDQDGDVFILGRATDCYTTPEGVKVFLFDAEYAILDDADVALCKVVDIDTAKGCIPVAHLILKNDADEMETLLRIGKLCKEKLEPYAVPQAYKIWESFPVHSNGKRDIEALKNEQDGLVTAEGKEISF